MTARAPSPGVQRRRNGLGDTEVGDGRRAAGEEDVVRLDVPVHHTLRVGILECAGHVPQHRDRVGDVHGAIASKTRPKRFALDEGHGVEGQPIRLTRDQHGHDVRVLEPGRDLNLPPEPLDADPGGQLSRKNLHDDLSSERRFLGDEDLGHATAAQLAIEAVRVTKRLLESIVQGRHRSPGSGKRSARKRQSTAGQHPEPASRARLPAQSSSTLLNRCVRSRSNGSVAPSGCHSRAASAIAGRSSAGRHCSTTSASWSTIQYMGTPPFW